MAVNVQGAVAFRPWPQRAVRDPIAQWTGVLAATGDATGGNITIQHDIPRAIVWNLEGLSIDSSALEASKITVQGDLGLTFGVNLIATPGIGGQANAIDASQVIALAGTYYFRNDAAGFVLLTNVNAAGKIIQFRAWGFVWDLDALKRPGGPLRP